MNLPTRVTCVVFHLVLLAEVVALLGGLAAPASAGLVLTVGPAVTTVTRPAAGNTTTITMTAFLAADVGTEAIANYSVPIDLSPPGGVGQPLGMTVIGATARTTFPGRTFTSSPPDGNAPGEGDLLVSVIGPFAPPTPDPIVFDTTATALFDFSVAIDSTIALGDYSVDVVRGVLLAFDPNLTNNVVFGPPATIRIIAVPEPFTLHVLSCCLIPVLFSRAYRRPKSTVNMFALRF